MVNIDVNQEYDIIDIVGFELQDEQVLIFECIDMFMDYLDDDRLAEQERYVVANHFYKYLEDYCNVWKQDQELIDDIIRVSNKYLNSIWLNARVIAIQEGAAYPDEGHIRDVQSRELLNTIHYFMDVHINA